MLPGRHPAADEPLHDPRRRRRSASARRARPSRARARLCCTKQVWKSTASPPGSGVTWPFFSAQASKGSAANSGRSLSRWMPTAFSMSTRSGRVRFATFARPRESRASLPGAVGIVEDALPERARLAAGVDPAPAVDELREVELELVAVARRVRALDLAQLALEAGVHHRGHVGGVEPVHVAVAPVVEGVEQPREAVAVLEAHPAAVTDLEGAPDLSLERRRIPVARVGRVVAESPGWAGTRSAFRRSGRACS